MPGRLAGPVPRLLVPVPPQFTCARSRGDHSGATCVRAAGELDIAGAPLLARMLADALPVGDDVILDLRGLTFVDGAGLRVIIAATADAHRSGRRLLLLSGVPAVDRILALTGTTGDVELVDARVAEVEPARA